MDFRPGTGGLYALSTDGHLYLIDPVTARVTRLHTFDDDDLTERTCAASTSIHAPIGFASSRARTLTISNRIVDPDNFAVITHTTLTGLPQCDSIVGLAYVPIPGSIGSTLYGVGSFSEGSLSHRQRQRHDRRVAGGGRGDADRRSRRQPSASTSTSLDATATGALYMTATIGGEEMLYHIDPATGATQVFASDGAGDRASEGVRDLLGPSVAARRHAGQQVRDDRFGEAESAAAATRRRRRSTSSGLQPGEVIEAIDVRPSTGELYGFSSASRLYRITPPASSTATSAVATMVGSGPIAGIAATSTRWEIDFDPGTDRLRVARIQPGVIFHVNPDTAVMEALNTFPFDTVGTGYGRRANPSCGVVAIRARFDQWPAVDHQRRKPVNVVRGRRAISR